MSMVKRHVGEYFHSRLQALITALLIRQSESAISGSSQSFASKCARRYRIPDIRVKPLPHELTPLMQKPAPAIEVLSPDDEPRETPARLSDYLLSGTPEIWMVHPYKRKLLVAGHAGLQEVPELAAKNDLVGEVDFDGLFCQFDEPAD
jgi:Uma2 family endonuclease